MTAEIALVLAFLMASLVLYTLLGGADFGAGILEVLVPRRVRGEARRLVSRAMAPVWEANHVWLILAVVILFMGFPRVYTALTVYLHLPLLALLLGIVGRGCAFTFRHYDTPSVRYNRLYSGIFSLSSLWCAVWIGVIAGAVTLGRIDPEGRDFTEVYVQPWFNLYCGSTAIFCVCLFTFLAAVYLTGETQEPEMRWLFLKASALGNLALVAVGGLVFVAAEIDGLGLLGRFFGNGISLACFGLATMLLVPFWRGLLSSEHGNVVKSLPTRWSKGVVRMTGAGIVTLVLLGWFAVQYPVAVALQAPGRSIEFVAAAAPRVTLRVLLGALLVGSALIFPSVFYLLRVFKWETLEREPGAEGRS